MSEDRTRRWLVYHEYDHKNGGTFWAQSGWADGDTPQEALEAFLSGTEAYLGKGNFTVLDWREGYRLSTKRVIV